MSSSNRKETIKTPTLAMLLKGFPRISETFISNEILRLEQHGIPIRIFSMRHPREPFCHESVTRIKAQVDYLPTDLFHEFNRLFAAASLCAVRKPHTFLQGLRKAGERFQRSQNLGTIKHLLQACYVTERLLQPSPEIVHLHAHFAHSPTSVAFFTSILSGLPFSFTAHAKDIYTSKPEQLREKIEKASMVFTCTNHNRDYLSKLCCSTPLYCLYHGIDLSLFEQRENKPVHSPFHILTVARMTEKKGIPFILRALSRLHKQGMDFTYTLIGDGDDRGLILELIGELGLSDRVRLLGTLPHEEVIKELASADVFVLGCHIAPNGDRDGIPNVLVESLAVGCPAVGTRVSALPEILINKQTGMVVEPEDDAALANALTKVLHEDSLRDVLISEGRRHVEQHFDNSKLIAQLSGLYRNHIPALASGT
ncbi:glycosyltransferase family 4 protein [Desulfogranum japonicum]|uniref:glycosyltransferase family 4 protein n=1 Tax=Desulfogranum japonicum TaxID=231447 RepID=UPI000412FDED|nr:glycosyltransferase family 4 protein [Desulfogranum japonicum]